MSQEIIKVFNYIGEKLGIAIDWTQDNVMPYLEDLVGRFVKVNIIEDIIGIIVWGILLIGCIIFGSIIVSKYYKCKNAKEKEGNNVFWSKTTYHYYPDEMELSVFGIASITVMGAISLLSIIWLPICIGELIKWIYIPEFQIAEEVSYILQGM